eukprot:3706329-Rhodomonas_salina.2
MQFVPAAWGIAVDLGSGGCAQATAINGATLTFGGTGRSAACLICAMCCYWVGYGLCGVRY